MKQERVLNPATSVRAVLRRLWLMLPAGKGLAEDVWRRRHRFLVALTWFHVGLIAFAGPLLGASDFARQSMTILSPADCAIDCLPEPAFLLSLRHLVRQRIMCHRSILAGWPLSQGGKVRQGFIEQIGGGACSAGHPLNCARSQSI